MEGNQVGEQKDAEGLQEGQAEESLDCATRLFMARGVAILRR